MGGMPCFVAALENNSTIFFKHSEGILGNVVETKQLFNEYLMSLLYLCVCLFASSIFLKKSIR